MTIEVTLAIDPVALDDTETTPAVGERLIQLGGLMTLWQPDLNGAPAKATFRFKNQARLDKFVADALAIRGVSLPLSRAELRQTDKEE